MSRSYGRVCSATVSVPLCEMAMQNKKKLLYKGRCCPVTQVKIKINNVFVLSRNLCKSIEFCFWVNDEKSGAVGKSYHIREVERIMNVSWSAAQLLY